MRSGKDSAGSLRVGATNELAQDQSLRDWERRFCSKGALTFGLKRTEILSAQCSGATLLVLGC